MPAEPLIRFGLILLSVAVYGQVVTFGFAPIDDSLYVETNQHVLNGLTPQGVQWAFQTGEQANWHPLTWISLMLDASLFETNAGGYHLTNLALHIASVLILHAALARMTGRLWLSSLVAALFAAHPQHVESVAWITERKDTLSVLFGMIAIWCYARYCESPSDARFIAIIIVFALSLLSKQTLVTLPFALLLLDFWPLLRTRLLLPGGDYGVELAPVPVGHPSMAPHFSAAEPNQESLGTTDPSPSDAPTEVQPTAVTPSTRNEDQRRSLFDLAIEKVPLLCLSAVFSIIVLRAQGQVGAVVSFEQLPFRLRLINIVVAYVEYLKAMFVPTRLCAYYPRPLNGWPTSTIIVAIITLTAISLLCLWQARRRPFLLVGWLWFLGTLAPMIGFVQVGDQSRADRYMYVPAIGLYIALAWGLDSALPRNRAGRIALGAIGAATVIACAAIAHIQVKTWRDGDSLFTRALAVTENNYYAEHGLAMLLSKNEKYEESLKQYDKVLAIAPQYLRARLDRGVLLSKLRRHKESVAELKRALEINPEIFDTHVLLAQAYAEMKDFDQAVKHLKEAIRIHPELPEAHADLGKMYYEAGKYEDAASAYRAAIEANPDLAPAQIGLIKTSIRQGKTRDAVTLAARAVEAHPTSGEAQALAGEILLATGRRAEALQRLQQAIEAEPKNPEVNRMVAAGLRSLGQFDKALAYYANASQLAPYNAQIRREWADLLFNVGAWPQSVTQFTQATHLDPTDGKAQGGLALALEATGNVRQAMVHFREACRLETRWPELANNFAWQLATQADETLRDGKLAVEMAGRACDLTKRQNPSFLDTLAAAQARSGQYDAAVKTADEAIILLDKAGQARAAREVGERRDLYKRKTPFTAPRKS